MWTKMWKGQSLLRGCVVATPTGDKTTKSAAGRSRVDQTHSSNSESTTEEKFVKTIKTTKTTKNVLAKSESTVYTKRESKRR